MREVGGQTERQRGDMPIPESGIGIFSGQLQGNWITNPIQIIRGGDIPRSNDR